MLARAGTLIAAALASLALIAPTAPAAGLADHVHVFAGTRPGHDSFGGGHNFPGAAAPFGMVQWSPDTTPADRNGRAGYDYRDSHIRGFSLTHLSGAGCSLYGDFPFLPSTEPIESSPAAAGSLLDGRFQPGFSHAHESGRPGYYAVRLNPVRGGAIETELTATTRTGIARFTFPRNPHSSVLINAGGSAQPDDFAAVNIDPANREIDGTASSGLFCGQRPRYRVYIAAVFNRPFNAYGTWEEDKLNAGATTASDSQAPPANPQDQRRRRRLRHLRHPPQPHRHRPRRRLLRQRRGRPRQPRRRKPRPRLRRRRQPQPKARWNQLRWDGSGSAAARPACSTPSTRRSTTPAWRRAPSATLAAPTSAWTASCTAPKAAPSTPTSPAGTPTAPRSSCSRSSRPQRAAEMVRSLLADAAESGCLPRWPYANGQSMTMVGDSADPLIASAAAFGATAFDRQAALEAMLRGADGECRSANGEYLERQGLAAYLARGYVPFDLDTNARNANSIYGSPDAVWGSAATSLEYAVDDFAIAQFAARSARRSGHLQRALCSVQATGASSSTATAA